MVFEKITVFKNFNAIISRKNNYVTRCGKQQFWMHRIFLTRFFSKSSEINIKVIFSRKKLICMSRFHRKYLDLGKSLPGSIKWYFQDSLWKFLFGKMANSKLVNIWRSFATKFSFKDSLHVMVVWEGYSRNFKSLNLYL